MRFRDIVPPARALMLLPLCGAVGCSPKMRSNIKAVFRAAPVPQGALIEKYDYDQLQVGKTTKDDALAVMGSPTAHATFNDNVWLYISLTTQPVPMAYPEQDSQNVLVAIFDDHGMLRDVKHLTRKDGMPVHMSGSKTPTPGTKISVLQELLGSVGRYNPLAGMGSAFGGMGGMMNQGGGMGGGMVNGQGTGNGGVGNSLP